jgi:hypothetical protein
MRESDFSPSFNAGVNNPWIYTSASLNFYMVSCFMKYREKKKTLPLYFVKMNSLFRLRVH